MKLQIYVIPTGAKLACQFSEMEESPEELFIRSLDLRSERHLKNYHNENINK